MKNVLITGGAGFIGQHLARSLLQCGLEVSIFDNFSSQIHTNKLLAADIHGSVRIIEGDIRNSECVKRAMHKVNKVVHLASETGTGQSMYQIKKYFDVNVQGTANLIEAMAEDVGFNIEKFVIASSRAVYGEGEYQCKKHGHVYPGGRLEENLKQGQFEPFCPKCLGPILPIPTSENSPLNPLSIYGLTKLTQEKMCLLFAQSKQISCHALRFQNVYGPGQSLINPYTGILAIFSNLARTQSTIQIYEDGKESRDFVYISDVINSILLSLNDDSGFVGALNVGSGLSTDVLGVAKKIVDYFSSKSDIEVSKIYRAGDIRHNFANLDNVKKQINFEPLIDFESGLNSFLEWAASISVQKDGKYEDSMRELEKFNLLGKAL